MLRPITALVVVIALPALACACIWDSDTLKDELDKNADTFQVITGQYARHGDAYYRARQKAARLELERAPDSIETLYDLGVAHLQLAEYDQALEAFQRVERIAPDRYKTHANLAALHGAKGDPAKAYEHMQRALDKNPAAHFDAGWLHLEMLSWQSTDWEDGTVGHCFLGQPYESWKISVTRRAQERAAAQGLELEADFDGVKLLTTLLRANPDFADGYLVLGRVLHDRYDLNLALWAYMKARALDHPRPDVIEAWIDEIFDHWKDALRHAPREGQRLEAKAEALLKIERELESAKEWILAFQRYEARLVAGGPDLPDFDAVRASLEAAGIHRRAPVEAGMIGGAPAAQSPANGGWRSQGPAKSEAQGVPGDGEPPVGQANGAQGAQSAADDKRQGASSTGSESVSAGATDGQLPWFVWFGLAMLVVSAGAAAATRGRRSDPRPDGD